MLLFTGDLGSGCGNRSVPFGSFEAIFVPRVRSEHRGCIVKDGSIRGPYVGVHAGDQEVAKAVNKGKDWPENSKGTDCQSTLVFKGEAAYAFMPDLAPDIDYTARFIFT